MPLHITAVKNYRLLSFFLIIYSLSFSCLAALPPTVKAILKGNNIPDDSLGVLIQPVGGDEPILTHNISQPFNPASVMKIITTYAALEILGPEYQWKTEFYTHGQLRSGTLSGDLYVKGYGDPYLVEETLLPALRSLRNKGLKHITGHLVIDNSHFNPGNQHPGEFDNKPYRIYNARPSALMTNFQVTRFTLTPDTDAGEVDISMWPESPDIKIENTMQLVNGKCRSAYRGPKMEFDWNTQETVARFKGKYSRNCGQREFHRTVDQPSSLFYGAFYPTWKLLDGTLTKGVHEGTVPENARLFYTHQSKPLSDIIRLINKHSNNVMTRQLMLTIAAEKSPPPGTLERGRQAINEWMQNLSIDTENFYIDNGSGLSRSSRVSAKTLNQIMQHQWQSPWMPEIVSSLSILGKDGTGKKRLKHSPLNGHMHLKTGLLDHVRTIAGFYHGNNGKRYIFIALQNHEDIHKLTGTKIQDALIKWLDSR